MIATLGSYDSLFGPCHMQTLSLAAKIAEQLSESGEMKLARRLFQRVVRDVARSAGRTHATRVNALRNLKDLLLEEGDLHAAIAAQTEMAGCWALIAGKTQPKPLPRDRILGNC